MSQSGSAARLVSARGRVSKVYKYSLERVAGAELQLAEQERRGFAAVVQGPRLAAAIAVHLTTGAVVDGQAVPLDTAIQREDTHVSTHAD